jgi:hypothetical protein
LNRELAKRRYREHDPNGEFLFTPKGEVLEEEELAASGKEPAAQIKLL